MEPMKARWSSRVEWLYRSCEEWTTACLFFEGRVEDKEIWGINHESIW